MGSALEWMVAVYVAAVHMHPANEKRRYIVTTSLIGWAQTYSQPCCNDISHWLATNLESTLYVA